MTTPHAEPEGAMRVNKAELFRLLGYEPHAGQALVHASKARYRVLACGVRWGKSVAASMEVVAAMLQPAGQARGWIVAPTRDLVDRIFERVVMTFRERLPHRIVELDERHQRLVVRNLGGGLTEVRGKSADNAVSLLGESLDWVVVEEAARLPREIWESHLAARLVDRRGTALLVSTPNGANWFMKLYRRGQRARDASFESWCSPSWTNPHLDAETIEEERSRLPKSVFDEQFGAQFAEAPLEPCDVCGGPSPSILSSSVITIPGPIDRCPECRKLVGPDGRTLHKLWPDGSVTCKVIILRPREEAAA